MKKKKAIVIVIVTLAAICLLVIFLCDAIISSAASEKLYTDVSMVPFNKIGLLLGTSKLGRNGYPNLYYSYRIEAATTLLRHNKIKYLVISGDNSRKDYNEPESMRTDLINAGADSTKIFLDYAGFRTFDSVIRLKEIFSQDSATIISQQFHNERAIYIASKENIYAIGFNATDVHKAGGIRTKLREKLARVKVILDFWFGKQPKFLGKKIQIPE